MDSIKYNSIFKEFKKVYRVLLFNHLDIINDISQGNLEFIIQMNSPQNTIDSLNLPKHYQKVPLTYVSNPNREVKVISLKDYQSQKKELLEKFYRLSDHLD